MAGTPGSDWRDVFPAVTTQFFEDGQIDYDATGNHLNVLLESGISGLVMLGSLGENNSLTREEKLSIIKLAKDVSGGKIPVVSGVSELNTYTAVDYVKEADAAGADGFMLLPAMAFRADRAETLAHYRFVATATEKPFIIYNNPIAYQVDITPDMLLELAEIDQMVAVKESCGDVRRITDIFNIVGDRFTIFAGVDDLALECALLGATGWIAGIGLAFPKENQRLWDLAMAGEWEKARELYRWYTPLLHLDVGTKFVQNIKLAIQEVGLGKEHVRMPRLALSGQDREHAMKVIHTGLENRPS
ncbi:MAG: dihydrodipicolinate synthase family protein [Armatimonadetes bacterium]|nr:dihydrodipicolinate synthase family protein [Armatimonadota bacterium]